MNQLDLKGRNAIVTGGAAGIGFAIAQRLATSGARVSLWDRDPEALAAGAKAIGGPAHTAPLDESDDTEGRLRFDESLRKPGRGDVLVLRTGITRPHPTPWAFPPGD